MELAFFSNLTLPDRNFGADFDGGEGGNDGNSNDDKDNGRDSDASDEGDGKKNGSGAWQ